MDYLNNPFTPGAGIFPPELAGRESVITDGHVLSARILQGRGERGLMLIGLRGVGKTVLLKNLAERAKQEGVVTVVVEIRNSANDMQEMLMRIKDALYAIDFKSRVKASVNAAYSVLCNFVKSISVNIGDFGVEVETGQGLGRTGSMEFDLSEVLLAAARAAKDSGTALGLYVDELQNLRLDTLRGIIVALHHATQDLLPLYLVGSGLPSIRGLIGKSKTYAERMFNYEEIGALDYAASEAAIANPLKSAGLTIDRTAMETLFRESSGYPYFLQEWGYQLWLQANGGVVSDSDMKAIGKVVSMRLDKNFFDVRLSRTSNAERQLMKAMADIGDGGAVSVSDVADRVGKKLSAISPIRASLLRKGMIYPSSYGQIAFTVPMFAEYLKRKMEQ